MKKYIFITNEGHTYQPNSQSFEPDIENMQVIGFGVGNTLKNALKNMIKENHYLEDTSFDEVIGIEIKHNNKQTILSLKENQKFC